MDEMRRKFRRILHPTTEETIKDLEYLLKRHNDLVPKHGCRTCDHLKAINNDLGFRIGIECWCGIEFKGELEWFNKEDCPMWKDYGYKYKNEIERLKNELD